MKIMAALDLSDYADFVLEKAIKTAKQQNAKMDIVVVVEDHCSTGDSNCRERVADELFQEAERAARAYQKNALAKGVKAKVRVRSGKSAAEEIIKYQKLEKLDLIVIGRSSHTSRASVPLGLVAQKVIAHATCTVMVVRCMEERERVYIEKKYNKKEHKWLMCLLLFVATFLFSGAAYASGDRVSGLVQNGFRILAVPDSEAALHFTVYRGDYIKFRVPERLDGVLAEFPSLDQKKLLKSDISTAPYFKMKKVGVYPFKIAAMEGEIRVIEFSRPSYTVLTAMEADRYIREKKPLVLDVRTPREYKKGHLENSVLIPVQDLQKRISELGAHKNSDILIYCATGNRSTVASKILIDSGFKRILNLRRGIVDWAGRGYPFVK